MDKIEVLAVKTRGQLTRFIDLPWEVYSGDPNWIPPLKHEVRRSLDPRKHPFWEFSEQRLFLALRGSRAVGRIAGIIDGNHNRHHRERTCAWGFFECLDDVEAGRALFSAVEEWGCERGMSFLRGPLNPSVNYEVGTLIENFRYPPTLMMTYNRPYYSSLIEAAGFRKEKDLFSYWVDRNLRTPEWVLPLVERLKQKSGVRIRHARREDFDAELGLIREIYNAAWSGNWGYVPMTEAEAREMGRALKPVVDPALVVFVYVNDQPIGVGFALPDWNPILKQLDGRIGPLGLCRIMRRKRTIKGLRGFIFGIKPEYQNLGVPILAYDYASRFLRSNSPYQYMELGWILEENPINDFIGQWGGLPVYRRYRIYGKAIGG